jgi:ATP-dependent helicase/nuclease subunit A
MKPFQAISASAGSGKTYQLTTRYIGLLALGAAPERIVALTFTRKAAGEMFDRILQRLAVACESAEARDALNRMLPGVDDLDRARCLEILRAVLQAMARLRIGTLDSFYSQVIKAFPLELGLSGDFEIMDDPTQTSARFEVLKRVLCQGSDSGRDELLEAFRLSTFGREKKRVSESFLQFVEDYQQIWLSAPEGSIWGDAASIWPDGGLWFSGPSGVDDEELQLFLEAHPSSAWQVAIDYFRTWEPGGNEKGNTLVSRLMELAPAMARGAVSVKEGRAEVELDVREASLLLRLIRAMVQKALAIRLQETKGIYQLIASYEADYHRSVRLAGRLTFGDTLHLLTRGPRLSRSMDGVDRLYIDYRLDGEFDHWLLDEFQDTSGEQWGILSPLLEEILQGESGRSFFYVGDVKQAIYGWRGGDAELFQRVLARHPVIDSTQLSTSWRSAPAVIETVNQVLNPVVLAGLGLDEVVIERWRQSWQQHEVAAPNRALTGYAALYEVERGGGREKQPYCAQLAVELVADLVKKRASVGVLVRGNEAALEMTQRLAEAGIAANLEGERLICEQPDVAAFLSLVKLGEHPGDRFAQRHVEMSPFASNPGGTHPLTVLRIIHDRGYEALALHYLEAPSRALIQLCRLFDASRNRNSADFIDYIAQAKVPVPPKPGSVTVMTLHKSKGLEFDAVVLPDLETKGLERADMGLEAHWEEDAPAWVLQFPAKEIVDADPVLGAHRTKRRQDGAYEALCLLYVGMTRARRGLYMITTAPPKKPSTVYPATVIQHGLSGEPVSMRHDDFSYCRSYELGDPDWVIKLAEPEVDSGNIDRAPVAPVGRVRYQRRLPSEETLKESDAAELFKPERQQSMEYGAVIHGLLQQVSWASSVAEAMDQIDWAEWGQLRSDVERLIAAPEVLVQFRHPGGRVDLWREQPFEVVEDAHWITGRFDRVVLYKDLLGMTERAVLIDWKCSRGSDDEMLDKYRGQMELYRGVLARLTGLPAKAIELRLVLLAQGGVVTF